VWNSARPKPNRQRFATFWPDGIAPALLTRAHDMMSTSRLLSFVVMRKLGIREAFTNDAHFRVEGFESLMK